MKPFLIKFCNLLILILSLAACGGGGGDDGGPSTPAVKSGILVDSPIEGIAYQSVSETGLTDSAGTYLYIDGEVITFFIGDLVLGSVNQGKEVLTPMDLGNTQYALNIARLLQSIDVDADPSNGIQISAEMRTALTGAGVTLDFNQAGTDFAADSMLSTIFDLIAPFTISGNIDLLSEQDTIAHLSSELNLGLAEGDVAGDYRVIFSDQPSVMVEYSFTAAMNGSLNEGVTPENLTWMLDVEQRLQLTIAGRTGLPQRFTLIDGTFLDGKLAVEIDQDQDGIYDRFVLATITADSVLPEPEVSLCGRLYNTAMSDNLLQHELQLPIATDWDYAGYNGNARAEYITFTNVVYERVPAIRIDNYATADDSLLESLWYAKATDGAIYQLNAQYDGVDYPCSEANLRFPANLIEGDSWDIENQGFAGTASVLSLNTTSPAGYTNTIHIRQSFDFGGDVINFDSYYRIGEGLLDWTDNITYWIHRTDIAPDNPVPAPGFGILALSSTLSADSGLFNMDLSINSANTTISWTGDGVTIVVSTLLGTTSMQGKTGVGYACVCLPSFDLVNNTVTFSNATLSDAFPFTPGPESNVVVINGTLTIPDPT